MNARDEERMRRRSPWPARGGGGVECGDSGLEMGDLSDNLQVADDPAEPDAGLAGGRRVWWLLAVAALLVGVALAAWLLRG